MVRVTPFLLAILILPGCAGRASAVREADSVSGEVSRAVAPGSTYCNPLDLEYRFALDTPSRRDVADPVIVRLGNVYYLFAARSGGYWHSRDFREWTLVVPTGMPMSESAPRVMVLGERIFLSSRESPAVYTSDDPRAGAWRAATADEASLAAGATQLWRVAETAPYDGGGFAGLIESGSRFDDANGVRWRVAAIRLSAGGDGGRRLGIFPVATSAAEGENADLYLGDYPRGVPPASGRAAPNWMLLSPGKKATASSSLAGHEPDLAFDENAGSWWSAASGSVGEWLSVDLGSIARVTALQVNFAEQGTLVLGRNEDSYQQYVIESSIDGVHWTTRVDASGTTRDAPHRYVQLDSARNVRFVRIINVHAAGGGNFAIRDLRIFGRSALAPPPMVVGVSAQRSGSGAATINWRRSARATGYVVRFWKSGGELQASHRVAGISTVTLDNLDRAAQYWFAVDAIGEGGVTRGTNPVTMNPIR